MLRRLFKKKLQNQKVTINNHTTTCIIEWKKKCRKVTVSTNKEVPLLDSFIDQELPVPYGCRNGACRSCIAKLVSGNVHVRKQYVLSPKELKENYILTCCSYLTSEDEIHITY